MSEVSKSIDNPPSVAYNILINTKSHHIAGGELVGKHINPGNEAFREALQTYYPTTSQEVSLWASI